MAKIDNGAGGAFKGTLGTMVGSSWKGIPYIKSKPKKRKGKVGDAEMNNRKKFGMSQAWLSPLVDFVRVGFKGYSRTVEGFVAAKSYLHKHAMEGEGKDLRINPALVRLSHGDLPLPTDIEVSLKDGNLEFTWNNPAIIDGSSHDQTMVVAYDIDRGYPYYLQNGEWRMTGRQQLKITSTLTNRTYHIYFAMVAADHSRRSNSVYLGTVIS